MGAAIRTGVSEPTPAMKRLLAEPVPHRVRAHGDGTRLVDYLQKTFSAVPGEELAASIDAGLFRLADGTALDADSILQAGTTFLATVPDRTVADPWLPLPPDELPLLWLDEHLVAIDKPAGLLAYPMGVRRVSALTILKHQLRRAGQPEELRPAHRLDRETTGVLLATRGIEADRAIKRAWGHREVRKTYLALVRGQLREPVTVDAPIGRDRVGPIRIKMAITDEGKPAVTDLRPLGHFGEPGAGWTWVDARPRTGRTHQIRLHLAHVGHPIVGDRIYCDDGIAFLRWWDGVIDDSDLLRLELPRQALHARTLELDHPVTGEPLRLVSPLPADLREFAAQRGGELPVFDP